MGNKVFKSAVVLFVNPLRPVKYDADMRFVPSGLISITLE